MISEQDIWTYFSQILTGLSALHNMGILHRDLKAANIFLHDGMIKLGDLNVSKI
jgi:NIMA (never in mitosis gene a)-related kinase 1/4/5